MRTILTSVVLTTVILLIWGCPGTDPGDDDTTEEDWGCDTVQLDIAMDEVHPDMGFSPNDLLETLVGTFTEDIAWWDDSTSTITVEMDTRDDARVLEKTPWGEEHAPDGELDWCVSRLAVDVAIQLRTDDLRLDLETNHSISALTADEGSLTMPPYGTVDSPDGDGTFVLDHDEWEEITPVITGTFTPGQMTGAYTEYGANYSGSGNELYDETSEIAASWPASLE